MLPAPAGPGKHAAARFDALDDSFALAGGSEEHQIAGCHDVALIGREGLEQPRVAQRCKRAVGRLHGAGEPMHAKHPAATAKRGIDVEHHSAQAMLVGGLIADHRAFASQLPFAADPLAAQHLVGGQFILAVDKTPSPIADAGRLRPILAKLADFVAAGFFVFFRQGLIALSRTVRQEGRMAGSNLRGAAGCGGRAAGRREGQAPEPRGSPPKRSTSGQKPKLRQGRTASRGRTRGRARRILHRLVRVADLSRSVAQDVVATR